MNKPVVNYDRTHDILYLVIREGEEHHFVETAEGIIVEFDENNQPIGIEISDASHVLFQTMEQSEPAMAHA